jgi:hypothetical protein
MRAHGRCDIDRPAPPWLQHKTPDRDFVKENDVHASPWENPDLIGGGEAFAL